MKEKRGFDFFDLIKEIKAPRSKTLNNSVHKTNSESNILSNSWCSTQSILCI